MSAVPPLDAEAPLGRRLANAPLDLADLEMVRLILRGNSVIDWNRAHFRTHEEVDRFLRVHLVDPDDPLDARRLRHVHEAAVSYLQQYLDIQFPEDLARPADIRDVFLAASQTGGFRRRQILACALLKLMHVVNHMEAAELRFYTPLSEAQLMDRAERRIVSALRRMREEGFPIADFYGSRKERNSIITKLLAKRDTTASPIFDKLRWRIVTERLEQIPGAIAWLAHNLFPFNYTLPGQSHNNLVPLDRLLRLPAYAPLLSQLQGWTVEDEVPFNPEENPFSGQSYRIVNFIVDFPVRVDEAVDPRHLERLGRCVFVLVEFQVVDAETARLNEEGENAHDLYKERQRALVASRLRKGARWKKR